MEGKNLSQQEIEELMLRLQAEKPVTAEAAETPDAAASEPAKEPPAPEENIPAREYVVEKVVFPELTPQPLGSKQRDLTFFRDVGVKLSLELGRTTLTVREILQLEEGSVIRLDSAAGDNAVLRVNGKRFADAEVVVINEEIACRIVEFKPRKAKSGEVE
ncbi:MAG: hypothetical protein GX197_09850 [Firmicutes bacterium]|nr:hypothetical protein [Bacillota bacterium]